MKFISKTPVIKVASLSKVKVKTNLTTKRVLELDDVFIRKLFERFV